MNGPRDIPRFPKGINGLGNDSLIALHTPTSTRLAYSHRCKSRRHSLQDVHGVAAGLRAATLHAPGRARERAHDAGGREHQVYRQKCRRQNHYYRHYDNGGMGAIRCKGAFGAAGDFKAPKNDVPADHDSDSWYHRLCPIGTSIKYGANLRRASFGASENSQARSASRPSSGGRSTVPSREATSSRSLSDCKWLAFFMHLLAGTPRCPA